MTPHETTPILRWYKPSDKFPKVGKRILVIAEFTKGGERYIDTDELNKGNKKCGQDPNLFYWANNIDFDDVLYWDENSIKSNGSVK
jgi:hypothetical protein